MREGRELVHELPSEAAPLEVAHVDVQDAGLGQCPNEGQSTCGCGSGKPRSEDSAGRPREGCVLGPESPSNGALSADTSGLVRSRLESGRRRSASPVIAEPKCIDVRTLGWFKVRKSGDHVRGGPVDSWNLEILCQKGRIYPHGGTRLQACTDRRMARLELKALGCVQVHQDGDFETTVIFDVRDFIRVAEVMKPRKKRPAPSWPTRGR